MKNQGDMPVTEKTLSVWQEYIHGWALSKGWWEDEAGSTSFAMKALLMHSEISEALEEYRKGIPLTEIYTNHNNAKPEGVPIELADLVIRVLDFCGYYKIDLEAAMKQKMAYNETRPYRHGNKKA